MLEELKKHAKLLDIMSYIISILSICCCFLFKASFLYLILGIVLGIIGIITAIVSRLYKADKTSIDSLMLSSIGLFFNILLALAIFITFTNNNLRPETKITNEPFSYSDYDNYDYDYGFGYDYFN